MTFRAEGGPLDELEQAGETLTLADAVRRAVGTSPELQAALSRTRAAQAEAELAGALPNPILSFVLRFPEGGGAAEVETGLGADLLALFQRPRRASAAHRRLEAEAALALAAGLDVVAGVEARYADVQALERLVPALERRAVVLARLRAVAEKRLELGEGAREEVAALEAEGLELAVLTGERRSELRVARLALAQAIGEPSGAAAWALEPWTAPAPVAADEAAWIDAALAQRPELLALSLELRARADDLALTGDAPFAGASAGVAAERDGAWSAGPALALPLPLFDGGGARAARARALVSEQDHRLTEARRGVVLEVRSALANLAGATDGLARVERDLFPLQERRRAEADAAYRLGRTDVTAVLRAERALEEAEAQRIELARAVTLAGAALRRAAGGPAAARSASPASSGGMQP